MPVKAYRPFEPPHIIINGASVNEGKKHYFEANIRDKFVKSSLAAFLARVEREPKMGVC